MTAGAIVQTLTTLHTGLDRAGTKTRTAALAREFKKRTLSGDELDRATDQAYWFGIVTGVVFVLLWLVTARLVATGRAAGRVCATLFAIVYTFTFLVSGVRTFGPGTVLGFLTVGIALSVVYLLWRRPVTPWFAARAARRSGLD